jgi:hypothetical protein
VWIGTGADPKVIQRILGHPTASLTMDLQGHVNDQNLWDAATMMTEHTGGLGGSNPAPAKTRIPRVRKLPLTWGFGWSRLSESNRRPSHYE